MKKHYINGLLFILVVLLVVFCAMYARKNFMSVPHDNIANSEHNHSYLHRQLNITNEQDAKLQEIENNYQKHRMRLNGIIRLANIELADAISKNLSFTSEAQQAIDKIHIAMGDLQKVSLEHLFNMQPILTYKQNEKLKELITKALYDNAKFRN